MYLKEKLCSMIVSTKSFIKGHKDRLLFAADIMDHFKAKLITLDLALVTKIKEML